MHLLALCLSKLERNGRVSRRGAKRNPASRDPPASQLTPSALPRQPAAGETRKWRLLWNHCPGFAPWPGANGCPTGPPSAKLRVFLGFSPLLSHLRADPAAGRRRPGSGRRRRAPLRPDRPRDAGPLRPAATLKGRLSACVTPISTAIPGLKSPHSTTGAPCSSFRISASTTGAPACPRPRFAFIMVGAHLPAHAAIPPRRPPGRGPHHRGLRRHHRLFPRRIHRHADGRAARHRPARLVRLV